MRSFSCQVSVPRAKADARTLALEKLGQPLARAGYKLAEQTPSGLTFKRTPLFGGPLWLFRERPTATITMSFEEEAANSTRMIVAGEAPRRIARQFERLAD